MAGLLQPLLQTAEEPQQKKRLSKSVPARIEGSKEQDPPPEDRRRSSSFHRDLSPMTWRSAAPLQRRHAVRRQRRRVIWAALGGGNNAAADFLSFPHAQDCINCSKQLRAVEARWGTGLCDECWSTSVKDCSICKTRLPLKQLQWRSGLCRSCFNACDKECRMCGSDLAEGQLHWGTGLCDGCYNRCEKTCRICSTTLKFGQLRWGSGLCDSCYDSSQKTCRICNVKLHVKQLRWGSGLCDNCYDDSEKSCKHCGSAIALGSMHWRTGLCDSCYDDAEKTCKSCNARLDLNVLLSTGNVSSTTGLCDACYNLQLAPSCSMCRTSIDATQQHWGTGLCDGCYNRCEKTCKSCKTRIPFGQLHWGSGLCDQCYGSCEKTCQLCSSQLVLGELHWGTRLCDHCFDKCEKACRGCGKRLHVGQLHWGTGLCDACYDAGRSNKVVRGVQAAIGAQLAFYLVPTMLQPDLYLQLHRADAYALVLMVASLAAMVLPVPLGLWAEHRGEREVYCGIALAAATASGVLALLPPLPMFAFCWAVLSGPPSIRGVRATFFAKHVPPEDLGRTGQLASSMGLLGGFLGPFCSASLSWFCAGNSGAFRTAALLGALVYGIATVALSLYMPRHRRHVRRDKCGATGGRSLEEALIERCEGCGRTMRPDQRNLTLALCDICYNNYQGTRYNYHQFRTRILVGFCLIASLLECSMNSAIVASFPPIVVTRFGWGSSAIASVNFMGAGISVFISFFMAFLRLKERTQVAAAASLYLFGVLIFTAQPLREWRLILGLMLGIKAQILFMAPFTAIFSRLIGKMRVTNALMTALCLAPAIGAAIGTALSPLFVAVADTCYFMLATFPAFVAVLGMAVGWHLMQV